MIALCIVGSLIVIGILSAMACSIYDIMAE
jgi:hypothetical protein